MKPRNRQHRSLNVSSSRWMAYAVAGLATASGGAISAEGAIHYTDPPDVELRNSANATFRLDDLGDKIAFGHRAFTSDLGQYNVAAFKVAGGLYASVRQRPLGTTFSFLSNLKPGSLVSQGYFLPGSFFKTMAHSGNGPFVHPGIDYLGFAFNNGSGKQYGWARVQMAGGAPGGQHKNNFRVLD